jgi:hypothetical protein
MNFEDIKKYFEESKSRDDCPHCNPYRRCPYCDPNYRRPDPWQESQCVLNQPLMMVIPPEGVHLSCPAHPEGHHIFGSSVTWMEAPLTPLWKTDVRGREFNSPSTIFDGTYRPIEYDNTQSKGVTFDSSRNRIVEFDSTHSFGLTRTGDNIF